MKKYCKTNFFKYIFILTLICQFLLPVSYTFAEEAFIVGLNQSRIIPAQNVTEIKLSLYKKDDMIYIEVSDNGIGIAEECIDEIGSEYVFHQDMDSFRYDKSHGIASGFGLSVVKRIANLHSGVFKAFANENEGSTMQIIFPDNILPNSLMSQFIEMATLDVIETELSVL